MADGKVKIEIDAEAKGLQKELNESSKKLKSYAKQLDNLDTKFKTIQKSRENAFAKSSFATDLQESKKALAAIRDEIQARKDRAKAMKEEYPNMAKLYAFSNKKGVNKGLVSINAKKWDVPIEKLEEYKKLLAEINSLSSAAVPMIGDVEQKQAVYDSEKAKLSQPNDKQSEILVGKEVVQGKWDAEAEKYSEISAKLDEINAKLNAIPTSADGASKAFSTMGNTALQSAESIAKFTGKAVWSVLAGSVKGLVAQFKKLHKSAKLFGKRLKYAIMQGLLLRPLRNMLSKVSEGFMIALKQNEQFSASLANIKGTIYTGLAPAFNALVPIISNFINWIAKALTYLFTFINVLFKLGGASKKAGKELGSAVESANDGSGSKGSNFASWDTVQQLSSPSSGASGTTPPTYEQDFSEAEGYLARLKEKILADDWYGVGMEISRGLNEILTTIDTWLVSTYIPYMSEAGTNIGNLFNGLWDGIDPELAGKTVADALNGVIYLVGNFFETADFTKMGSKLATNLNSLFTTLDAEELGDGVHDFVTDIMDLLDSFIENYDPTTTIDAIVKFLSGIKLGKLIGKLFLTELHILFTVLGEIVGGLVGRIWTLLTSLWEIIKNAWHSIFSKDGTETGKKSGKDIIKGFFSGILEKLKSIGEWIKEHIFQPFIDGFKKAFKIHSPSKVMEEQGNFIVDGLLSGIKAIPEKVKAVFESMKTKIQEKINTVKTWMSEKADAIKDKFVGAFTKIKTKVTDVMTGLKNAIKKPINGIIGFINKLISGIVNGINNMIRALNKLHFTVPSWIPVIGGKSFGFNLKTVSAPQIPYLAQGTVVNPSHEFLAMLGDNRQEQEIVSPLSTMKQALLEALHESGMSGNKEVVLQLDGKTLARATVPYYNNYSRQLGISAIR